jgi:Right handed beta helix region
MIVVTSLGLLAAVLEAIGFMPLDSHALPDSRPAPSPASSACAGVFVPPGVDLGTAMGSSSAGTTYCLGAGTFKIGSPIQMQVGDRVIGSGRDATFIDGTDLPPTAHGVFLTVDGNYFADLNVFGAPTPPPDGSTYCAPYESDCGIAFVTHTGTLTIRSIDCHDNGGNCIGGGGSMNVTVDDLDCWNNGNAYSMTPEFLYAACIKRAAVYSTPGNTTITNSFIHDNPWVGIWCDYCKYGFFDIEHNRIVHNGHAGVQWEMSGGWTSNDHALITENVIQGNNYRNADVGGGISISTANDVTIQSNDFARNRGAAVDIVFTTSRDPPQSDSEGVVVRNNRFHGDAIVGCGRASYVKRLALLLRERFGLGLVVLIVLVALVLFGRFLRVQPRMLLLGLGGALVLVFVVVLIPLIGGAGAECIANM